MTLIKGGHIHVMKNLRCSGDRFVLEHSLLKQTQRILIAVRGDAAPNPNGAFVDSDFSNSIPVPKQEGAARS